MSSYLRRTTLAAHLTSDKRRSFYKAIGVDAENHDQRICSLEDKIVELESQVRILLGQLNARKHHRHLTTKERLIICWHLEYFRIPKRKIREYFGITQSTLTRWLQDGVKEKTTGKEPANKTPAEIIAFVWEIFSKNPRWGN